MSKIDEVGKYWRDKQLKESGNRYSDKSEYSATNPDALSDGDNFGRDFNSGSIGTLKDSKTRDSRLTNGNKNGDIVGGKEYNPSSYNDTK